MRTKTCLLLLVPLAACGGAHFEAELEHSHDPLGDGGIVEDATVDDGGVVVIPPPGDDDGDDAAARDGGNGGGPPDSGASSCGGPDASFQYCGGDAGCVDLLTSADNCSTCGHVCPAPAGDGTATCMAGKCGVMCDSIDVQCPGTNDCVNPDDPTHCGATCEVCPGPDGGNGAAACPAGACEVSCSTGYVLCDGTCHPASAAPSDPCLVTNTLAVFVAPGGTGTGTKAAPLGSIQAGVTAAATRGVSRVYVCGGTLTSGVAFTATSTAVSVYGGFACANWAYAPTTSHVVVSPPSGIPLTFTGSTAAIALVNLEFDAANASGYDAKGNGSSSIAAFAASSSNVALVDVILSGGNAVDGVAGGASAPNYTNGATAPIGDGPASGDAGLTLGGVSSCVDGTSSKGGAGGESSAAPGGVQGGGPGLSTPTTTTTTPGDDGFGGDPGTGSAQGKRCISGDTGANGAAASAVAGTTTWGTLSASGWAPAEGTPGINGDPGQGGGGGGGSTSPPIAGGSGGAGGCGGTGGLAGTAGGSSFALLSFDSSITLTACTLNAGNAGAGGGGGTGEIGQGGGSPGLSTCGGGYGGNGAGGGGAGGAAAGVSVGVGYVGTEPSLDVATTFTGGTVSGATSGGGGGTGGTNIDGTGSNGNTGGSGKAGVAARVQVLD